MNGRPLVIGVAGGSGSGKTTVVRRICGGVAPATVSVLHHDAYYREFSGLSREERDRINFDHPESLETELLVRHLDTLLDGGTIQMPVYDFTDHTRALETVRVEPTAVIVVDGILVLAEPELRQRMDIRVFVDADPDVRFIRRLDRDITRRGRTVESVIEQYRSTVRPMHLDFVEPSKRWADIIIPKGGHNEVAVDMIVTKMHAILSEAGALR